MGQNAGPRGATSTADLNAIDRDNGYSQFRTATFGREHQHAVVDSSNGAHRAAAP